MSTVALKLPLFAAVVGAVTFPATATFNDMTATYYPARQLLSHGTMQLAYVPGTAAAEFVGGYSDRMPGMIFALLPFAWLPVAFALALAGAFWTSLAVFFLERLYGRAIAATALLATPFLYVGREYWPQTIDLALLLGGLYALSKGRTWLVWPALAGIAVTRPPFAVFAALAFLLASRQSWRYVTLGASVGIALLAVYTRVIFHRWGITGGFSNEIHGGYSILSTLYTGLLSPQRGVLFYTPFLLCIRKPSATVILAGLYTLAEWQQFDAWGGNGYLGYRYALPFTILALPYIRDSILSRILIGWSIGVTAYCLFFDRYLVINDSRNPNLLPMQLVLMGVVSAIFISTMSYWANRRKPARPLCRRLGGSERKIIAFITLTIHRESNERIHWRGPREAGRK